MMPSPGRAFVRLVGYATASIGALIAVGLLLLRLDGRAAQVRAFTAWCLLAPASLFDWAVHSTAFGAWLLAGLVTIAAVRSVGRQRFAGSELRESTRQARLVELPRAAANAARAAGLIDLLDVVDAPHPFAFVYGWLRPRVCLSTGLVARLSEAELTAVLHHERWHLRRRDPVRLLVVRTATTALGWLPGMKPLAAQYTLAAEVAADRYAVAAMGSARWLAGALSKIVESEEPRGTVAFAGLAEARIAALAGEARPVVNRRPVELLIAGAELVLVAIALAQGDLHPLLLLWSHPVC